MLLRRSNQSAVLPFILMSYVVGAGCFGVFSLRSFETTECDDLARMFGAFVLIPVLHSEASHICKFDRGGLGHGHDWSQNCNECGPWP